MTDVHRWLVDCHGAHVGLVERAASLYDGSQRSVAKGALAQSAKTVLMVRKRSLSLVHCKADRSHCIGVQTGYNLKTLPPM